MGEVNVGKKHPMREGVKSLLIKMLFKGKEGSNPRCLTAYGTHKERRPGKRLLTQTFPQTTAHPE